MPRLSSECAICNKTLRLTSESPFGPDLTYRTYACGHSFVEDRVAAASVPQREGDFNFFSSSRKKRAFEFQEDGVRFIHQTDFNCLIADPMGLGKTIQALLAAREARNVDGSQRFKAILVLVKSATQYQWFAESKDWYDPGLWSTFLIKGSRGFIPPGFAIYVMSMDTLSRFTKTKTGLQALIDLNFDLVIVDECHSFKNPDSARSQGLIAFMREISVGELERTLDLHCVSCDNHWTETTTVKVNLRHKTATSFQTHYTRCPQCDARISAGMAQTRERETKRSKGLILLSGTPIKNRADEYFVPLNLLRPDVFTDIRSFRRNWLDQDPNTHKWNRIKRWKLDEFREMTKDFIIRREKSILNLPAFRRTFERISFEDDTLRQAYNKALDELQKKTESESDPDGKYNFFDVEANLMTLRRICGMAKIPFALEYVETFLDTTEDEKIAIGVHHEAVRDALYFALKEKGFAPLKLSGEDNAENKNRIQRLFCDDPERRVLIINMLAGGVGLNLQACNNTLILERQWSAADEEQFEGRFHRSGQTKPVLAEYMIAEGTIDQYFMELVENKRQICGESLDGWDFKADSDTLRDLVTQTLSKRL